MQVKTKLPICSKKACREVEMLFDTGAKGTYISDDVARRLGGFEKVKPNKIPLIVKDRFGTVIGEVPSHVIIQNCRLPYTALVMKDLQVDAVIGTSFMEQFGVELSLAEGKVKLKKCPPDMGGIF